ncbi:MAG: hypothetical protein ACYC25_03965 [Paludibacter sp.]
MLYPMTVLAVLSVIGGFIQLPKLFSETQGFDNYLSPVFEKATGLVSVSGTALDLRTEWMIFSIPLLFIALLIFLSYKRFVNEKEFIAPTGIQKLLSNKFYFDEIYDFLIVKPLGFISDFFRGILDQTIINGFVNAVGSVTLFAGKKLRLLQTGNVGFYLILMVFSIIAILFFNIIL